jgi:Lrp/AsnC family transcriptional regulator, leucine-responsive regulatory protein
MRLMTLNQLDTEKLLDHAGWEILRELQQDARISFSELGRRVGLTSPAVAERVRRMEEAGIICGYHADVNLSAVGLQMLAILSIRSYPNKFSVIGEMAQGMPEVLLCHVITGADCFFIKVAVSSVQHLEQVIKCFMPLGQVTTSLILNTPVFNRVITPIEETFGAS